MDKHHWLFILQEWMYSKFLGIYINLIFTVRLLAVICLSKGVNRHLNILNNFTYILRKTVCNLLDRYSPYILEESAESIFRAELTNNRASHLSDTTSTLTRIATKTSLSYRVLRLWRSVTLHVFLDVILQTHLYMFITIPGEQYPHCVPPIWASSTCKVL